jgi:protein arginine kinase activator
MVCQNCGQREASILVQTVHHNHVKKTALCGGCAGSLAPADALSALMNILSHLSSSRVHPGRCPGCRSSWAEFKQKGRLGCAQCYEQFGPQLRDLLPRVHGGAYHHRGKTPGRR